MESELSGIFRVKLVTKNIVRGFPGPQFMHMRVKDSDDISWKKFNFLLESVSFEDTIGHLYIVDIEFDLKMRLKKNLLIMKFICRLLKNKELLILVKDLYYSCWNNLLEVKIMHKKLADQQLRHTQIFF